MGDIDWKGILEKAIDIGGPILGTVINVPAPGVGTAVAAGLPLVKKYVVEPYVPGAEDQAASTSQAEQAPSVDHRTALAVLQKKGWSEEEAQQHLQGPVSSAVVSDSSAAMPEVAPEHGALLVHGVLASAGWHPAARQALLSGPYAFAEYLRPARHSPDDDAVARLRGHDVDALLSAGLHHATERGGHTPELYHGTHDALVAGLGETTEQPGTKV